MSLDYIRDTYKVPAKKGARVSYTGGRAAQQGTIVSARSAYIRVIMDGDKLPGTYHPAWEMTYLDEGNSHE